MDATRIFHVAFVVNSLEDAIGIWEREIGLKFGPVQRPTVRIATPDAEATFTTAVVYSFNGPPYIELIERQADSVWSESGFHHLGIWSAGVAEESDRLTESGCAWQSAIVDSDHRRVGGCIHTLVDNAPIELVSRAATLPRLARYIGGGSLMD
jgi:hypothetical protein